MEDPVKMEESSPRVEENTKQKEEKLTKSSSSEQQPQPVLGKRVSKKTEVLNISTLKAKNGDDKEDRKTSHSGTGISLADYEYFNEQLSKLKGDSEVLKGLHTILYNTPGKKSEIKKHFRIFNGFSKDMKTDKLEEITEKVIEKKKLWTVTNLKTALSLFGCEKSGDREELAKRLISYLAKPEILKKAGSSGGIKKSSSKKRKASSSSSAKNRKDGKPKKKRAPSAFILFGQDHREEIKQSNPSASFGEIGKLIGNAWNSLDEKEKKVMNWFIGLSITDAALTLFHSFPFFLSSFFSSSLGLGR
jgi:hypothetical protein